jgi:tetratricopeptide (TPR) repeat protein
LWPIFGFEFAELSTIGLVNDNHKCKFAHQRPLLRRGGGAHFRCLIPAAPALALTQQEIDRCVGKKVTPDLQINGCTAAIQSEGVSVSDLAVAYHNRGLAYAKRGDLKDAIADFDQAIRLNPQSARPYNDGGITYARQGNFNLAIADFDRAIRLDPTYVLAFRNRGFTYYAKREYDRAIADYDVVIWLDPKNIAAYNDRGNIYHVKGGR